MKSSFSAIILLLSLQLCAIAQNRSEVAQSISTAYQEIQNFNFRNADSILVLTEAIGKEASALELAKANFYWWLIISGEDVPSNRNQYITSSEKAINGYKDKSASKLSDEELYIVITGYANRARIEGLEKNYLKGFGHINTCLKYIQQSFGKEKRFIYFTLTSGLYNYYMATANKSFPVLLPYLALFPDGDLKKGLDFLTVASQSGDIPLSTEAHYFLLKIYLDNKEYSSSLKHCLWLTKAYSNNLLYNYYHFKILLDQGHKDQALEVLSKIRLKEMMNTQLTDKQKKYYSSLATQDLKEYYIRQSKNK